MNPAKTLSMDKRYGHKNGNIIDMRKTRIGFVSLGCPKNQIDTEVMLHELIQEGYEIVAEDIKADIIIINTCAFITSAKKEAIDNILDIAWLKKKRLRGIIVTGCLAERYREQLLTEMPEIDAVLGTGSIHDIVRAVRHVDEKTKNSKHSSGGIVDGEADSKSENEKYHLASEGKEVKSEEEMLCVNTSEQDKFSSFIDKNKLSLGGDRAVTTPEYFAYMKIAEGCDNCCTYCIIPKLRGNFRSRPIEELISEAKTLEGLGVKELVLVAQDTSRYGEDLYGEYSLAKLIRAITENTKIPWIRILYCYPDKITDELIEEFKNNSRLVNYIDIPIQHISDSVLRRMNRHGGSAVIRNAVDRLRKNVPGIVIRTTAIVGFPGETEEEFSELCEYIKEAHFERFGAFTYSREEDTPAYDFENQIAEQIKQDRYDIIMKQQMEISDRQNRKKLGKTEQVICEGYDSVSETYFGRSYADAPEIDGKIYFSSERKLSEGEFVSVKINDILDYDLIGKVVEK